jgi:hypothetical protein
MKRIALAASRVREATAVYFEWLAQKETRDYDRRQRLSEMARFYRSLAGIIPAMPTLSYRNDFPISRLPDTTKEQLVLDYRYHRPRTNPGVGG